MPTLRRILKYTPAVVLGLLVVALVVSVYRLSSVEGSDGKHYAQVILWSSSLNIHLTRSMRPSEFHFQSSAWRQDELQVREVTGHFDFVGPTNSSRLFELNLPLPLVIVGLLPLAIGPFFSFRFRLWHYLVYTALVALELAYYLRWQE